MMTFFLTPVRAWLQRRRARRLAASLAAAFPGARIGQCKVDSGVYGIRTTSDLWHESTLLRFPTAEDRHQSLFNAMFCTEVNGSQLCTIEFVLMKDLTSNEVAQAECVARWDAGRWTVAKYGVPSGKLAVL